MSMTLWLVRHGETDSNAEHMFQGHLDVGLNARGEQQALAVADHLSRITFDSVYASDLSRAARTAELIVGDSAVVVLDRDLREMNYGVLQGVRYADAANMLEPHGLSESWVDGTFHRNGSTIPGGEPFRRFRARSRRFISVLDDRYSDGLDRNVLVVAHGGTLGVLMTVLLDLPLRARSSFRFGNCGISRLTRTLQRTTLDLHNLVVWDERDRHLATSRAQSDRPHDGGESHPLRS